MTKTVAVNLRRNAKSPKLYLIHLLFCSGVELISCIKSGSVSTWHSELHTIWLMPECPVHSHLNSRESFLGNDLINDDVAFFLWDILLLDRPSLSQTQTNGFYCDLSNGSHIDIDSPKVNFSTFTPIWQNVIISFSY